MNSLVIKLVGKKSQAKIIVINTQLIMLMVCMKFSE